MPIFAHPFRTPKTLRAFTRSSKGGRFFLYLCLVPLPSAWDLQKPCTLGRINVTYHRAPQGLGRGVPAALRGFFFNLAA